MYLKMLKEPANATTHKEPFIFQQDGAPSHWHTGVQSTSMETRQVCGLAMHQPQTTSSADGHQRHQTWLCVSSSSGVSSKRMFISPHLQRRFWNCEDASTMASRASEGWQEWEYHLDICNVTRGVHVECI